MSKITEFENIPDIDIDGGETLEEAVADCRALFEKYNKEMYDGSVSLAQCAEARMVLLVLAHRSHHTIEFSTACLKAELLPTSTGPNLDNLAPMVGVERMAAGKATAVVRFTLSAARASATSIPEGTQVRTGEKQFLGDDEIMVNLAKYEKDEPVHIDVVRNWDGALATSIGKNDDDLSYAAQIDIPARAYTEKVERCRPWMARAKWSRPRRSP